MAKYGLLLATGKTRGPIPLLDGQHGIRRSRG